MNYKWITGRVRSKDLFKIFLLIGFVLASTRIENFQYQRVDYNNRPIPVNNEPAVSEKSNNENIFWGYDEQHESPSACTVTIRSFDSFTYAVNSYNGLILTRYKAIISNTNFYSGIISIIQKTNIWHKSSKKEPVLG